jgi:two-component system response regulator YesN
MKDVNRMYRILIVDDEKDERDVVCFLLKKYGFQLNILEAENGRDALNLLKKQQTDILFTDVRMPFLYGTDLAAKARELYPNIQILFFSGYDDFAYAKEALTLGAVDYILKPIHPEEFRKTIQNTLQKLDDQKCIRQKQSMTVSYMRNHILSRLLNGVSVETLREEYGTPELLFLEEYQCLFLLQFDSDTFDRNPQSFFEKAISAALVERPYHFLNLNPCQSLVLLKKSETSSLSVRKSAQSLQQQLSNVCGKPCYISVGDPLRGAKSIPTAYEQAEQALEDRFFYTDIYLYPIHEENSIRQDAHQQDDALMQSVEKAIRYNDAYILKKTIHILFQKYQKKQNQSHIYVRYIFSELAEILYRVLPSCPQQSQQKVVEQIFLCQHFSDIQAIISDILSQVVKKLEDEQDSPKHAIYLVQQYIQNHYEKDLSLERLAEQVFLSPRYLSDLFIRETGCGINKYIKNLRMEKAKELLLGTNQRIQDICKKVGYSNFSYFCRSFRENFGETPDSFRQSAH